LIPGKLLIFMLILMPVAVAAGEYSLYLPAPVETGIAAPHAEGILVKNIIIRRGDTLSNLSREYSGKGKYYPQILLFNKIRNPNRIYAGQPLLVPVTCKKEVKRFESTVTTNLNKPEIQVEIALPKNKATSEAGRSSALTERFFFEKVLASYKNGEYNTALEGFTRFLKEHPESSLAADASLYRADCLLYLSNR
jgi:LysM repeat protein